MRILAVTACPTGVAHTYMAAEALEGAAKEKGIEIKVETRGSVGVENGLTPEDIKEAEAIIVAADTDADVDRFKGKPVVSVPVGAAIKDPAGLIEEALEKAKDFEPEEDLLDNVQQHKAERSSQRTGFYKHLMNGVSNMLPFVVAGGLAIALSFVFGIKAFEQEGTLAAALMTIGGGTAFALMIPVLAGFIASSIADRPGFAPGMVGGMLAANIGAGFLGGLVAGFLAGYITKFLNDNIKLPKNFQGLKPVLILPLLSVLIIGLLMIYVLGTPMKNIMDALTAWLQGMSGTNRVLLGLILGAMMAFDMGGPVNKAAYTFATGLLASEVYAPMAAVMAAGMVPPLAVAVATFIAPKKFDKQQKEAGKAAAVLGISFITEGAIPFAAADPVKVIPSIIAGSAVTGALSMLFNATLRAPHGGIFTVFIPGAVGNVVMYAVSILVGTIVSAALISILKDEVKA
ncbi:PTS system D-fructose-specific IIB component (F1P-forming) (Frc family) /PTS system D-fructose-specific IIC component (F1P-forming) (Frc family) [Orenia metallireducens]|jgi:PTS system fructose-specific IIC component|uniref:PTS system D-fructose-specific IIB component (F1P-forming), Frc family /PTS system D-fructose-specific IIC component (F1P-forming), Frc family n=1 Tax=Orenia metallireducens TaxID=1413210 RepID=A0A285G1I6_9FIRM|nr:fructose-specific PTS transporter subunit EIIC [Orenia metallireducens]PRX31687.1 PTS system D-fructose-specific IIB component (F1P-forming) (Frc family) /PTS system D-fructose-specific IIC component (F1P-forming) (Frc family) [Orenia metallireducens]SNY16914.1 PTS system D-fructose-specific IIB component (F1P-forming), Frc family /PTS system D-fructose-specific IIC component (F1P-forming), Frc family [Orenia metallireducens]